MALLLEGCCVSGLIVLAERHSRNAWNSPSQDLPVTEEHKDATGHTETSSHPGHVCHVSCSSIIDSDVEIEPVSSPLMKTREVKEPSPAMEKETLVSPTTAATCEDTEKLATPGSLGSTESERDDGSSGTNQTGMSSPCKQEVQYTRHFTPSVAGSVCSSVSSSPRPSKRSTKTTSPPSVGGASTAGSVGSSGPGSPVMSRRGGDSGAASLRPPTRKAMADMLTKPVARTSLLARAPGVGRGTPAAQHSTSLQAPKTRGAAPGAAPRNAKGPALSSQKRAAGNSAGNSVKTSVEEVAQQKAAARAANQLLKGVQTQLNGVPGREWPI
eukprot:TRINITY_DN78131_c0_g1_i1.p1 TRINITY_DN78131_c0_g1~~TRINITY_DN78131_c0_g1_i1.p1  ORF type:complete len:327 (-),score=46.38 TRINITY_DN78131_c0_g1_i1:192-1172(-)